MSRFGFEELEKRVEESDIIEDKIPEVEETESKTKRGDLYKLGDHYLMCGDATKKEDVDKLMGGEKADLFISDPPYNVDYSGNGGKILNDNKSLEEFRNLLNLSYANMLYSLREGGAYYVFHASMWHKTFREELQNAGSDIKSVLVWVKSSLVLGRQDYQWRHEPCLYGWKEGAPHYFTDSRSETTVIEDKPNISKMSKSDLQHYIKELWKNEPASTIIREDKPTRNELHPTMKPVKLFAYLIQNSSRTGEKVLDLFGGSGTTMIACEQTNRKSYLMELDEKYCDVIIQRWENFTGKKAEKINEK